VLQNREFILLTRQRCFVIRGKMEYQLILGIERNTNALFSNGIPRREESSLRTNEEGWLQTAIARSL
jgi:hypothetical protein